MNLSAFEILALVRLVAASDKGETREKVGKDLAPLVEGRWRGPDLVDRLNRALEDLEAAGAVERLRDRKGKSTKKLAITAEGRRAAAEALGLEALPPKVNWAKLRSTYLPALALGRPGPGEAEAKYLGGANGLKAELLRARYELDLGDRPAIRKVGEATAARLLGLEAGQAFTADNILRKLLRDAGIELPAGQKPGPSNIAEALFRRELGDPSAKKPLDLLATRSVGARQNSAAELVAAVLRSWVDRSEPGPTETHPGPAPEPEAPPAPVDLEEFARRVARAALGSPSGRFGDAKVFISHVRRALLDDPDLQGVDDSAFKERLVEAHRARLLELGRADLVEAMDPVDVRESATPYLNAVYHFVRIEEPAP